jgi:signal transduction histidine kinase
MYHRCMTDRRDRSDAAKLARRDAILAAVACASERLGGTQPWEAVLTEVLGILGDATGVSRAYVFEVEWRDGVECVSQRFEWCAPGIPAQIDNPGLQGVPIADAGFTRWGEVLRRGEAIYGDIHEFPESERPLLEVQEIRSLLAQPIFEGTRWYGFMGFDACESLQSWERVEVDTLRIATLVLGAAMQRQKRDAQLRETQKLEALGRMASSVAHDFNNVLMIVAGGLELLKTGFEPESPHAPARETHSAMIDQALGRAAALTRRLLDFSRRQSGIPQVVSVLELLQREAPLLRQAVGSRVELRIAPATDGAPIAPICVEPTEFAQVILNLAVNARDAMPAGGVLSFAVSTVDADDRIASADGIESGAWTLLTVTDEGEGMTPEALSHAFEPFYTTKPRGRGTGLGLATIQGIVTAARGHVRVTSSVGRGTQFRIYFPAADPGR